MIFASACDFTPDMLQTTPVAVPTEELSGWDSIADGMHQRTLTPNSNLLGQITAVRIDPSRYEFRVHYSPGNPHTISEWQTLLPDAKVIVNANFFDPNHNALGLLISDGIVHSPSYVGRGGTLAVQDGIVNIRSNVLQPYQGEQFDHAVQAYPNLVVNGERAYARQSDRDVSRRTAIAQDQAGHIILMTTPLLGLSLNDLSAFLADEDLNIVNAFNLDGGGSTMMRIAPSNHTLQSLDPVPTVLAIYEKPA